MNPSIPVRALAAATLLATGTAHAVLLFDPADVGSGSVIGFDAPSGSGLTSPVDVGLGSGHRVLFSTRGGPGSIGEAPLGAWVLGANGDWSAGKTFAGVDGGVASGGQIASMTFDFGPEGVKRVGGVLNFDPDFSFGGGLPLPLYIAAYSASGALLEGHELPLFTPGGFNEGVFYGIGRARADIARFVIEGPYAVVDDLSFTTPVPEPATPALLLAGLGIAGLVLRRRRLRES